MYSLLLNNCIKYVALDEEANGQTGEVVFLNGEVYDGEIQNGKPFGTGKLTLTDGSHYHGTFDNNGIIEGKYTHFSYNYFEGTFVRDRFKKGKIMFSDGDVLVGEWGIEKSKWSLKWCHLNNEEGENLGKLVQENRSTQLSIKSRNKEIFRNYEKFGFCVVFTKSSSTSADDPEKHLFTADGTTFDEKKTSKTIFQKIIQKTNIQLPFSKIEDTVNNCITKSILKLCFGMTVETEKNSKQGKLSFKDLKKIYGIGAIEFTKLRFKFSGDLFLEKSVLGEIIIKKSSFSQLTIKLREKEFNSMKSFFEFIRDICENEYDDSSISLPKYPSKRRKSVKSEEAMKEMITDIKKHSDCTIM